MQAVVGGGDGGGQGGCGLWGLCGAFGEGGEAQAPPGEAPKARKLWVRWCQSRGLPAPLRGRLQVARLGPDGKRGHPTLWVWNPDPHLIR